MAKINVKKNPIRTHEGAPAKRINAELQLRRSVMACMLWEKTFYEDGESIADRIKEAVAKVDPATVRDIAIEARTKMKLRHVPLLIARTMAALPTHRKMVAETLENIIQRADELTEFISIYWKEGRQPLSAQVKKGLARAFTKFDAYQLAKYNRDGAVKLRDALFLSHAKPKDEEQAKVWKQLVDGTLAAPDTWEVSLSATKGENKKDAWERLIDEKKLGGLAFLRNLRNMREAGVNRTQIARELNKINVSRVLPFRFISAAKHNIDFEPELERLLFQSVKERPTLSGRTAIAVDVSASMNGHLSEKSEITMIDAACALAMVLREMCVDGCDVFAYGTETVQVPARRGFALRDAIKQSRTGSWTDLGKCVRTMNLKGPYDRMVVVTDEQSGTKVPDPDTDGYVINVAPYKNGIGYGKWSHIDGWSESVLDFIVEYENLK